MTPFSDDSSHAPRRAPPELLNEREWMRRLALHLVGDAHGAADLEQDTWVKLLRQPPGPGVSLRAWIATVMRNTARNSHRGRRRRELREQFWSVDQPTEAALGGGPESDVLGELRGAVGRLGEPYHETIALRFFRQLTPKEIGEHLGIPAATVRTRLRRALQQLREDLDRRHGDERQRWVTALVASPLLLRGSRAGVAGAQLASRPLLLSGLVSVLAVGSWWISLGGGPPVERVPQPVVVAAPDAERPAALGEPWQSPPAVLPVVAAVDASDLGALASVAAEVEAEAEATSYVLEMLDEQGGLLPETTVRILPLDTLGLVHEGAPEIHANPAHLTWEQIKPSLPGDDSGVVRVVAMAPGRRSRELLLPIGWERASSVTLPRGASLEVLFRPSAGFEPVLRLRTAGRMQQEFRPEPGPDGSYRARWDGLKPGEAELLILCRKSLPLTLEKRTLDLSAGEVTRLEIDDFSRAHSPPATGVLRGTVVVRHDLADSVRVVAHALLAGRDHWLRGDDGQLPEARYTIGAAPARGLREVQWSLGAVPEGDYQVLILPLGTIVDGTVQAGGETHVQCSSAALSELDVQVVSGVDGRALPDLSVVWQPSWALGQKRSRGVVAEPQVRLQPDDSGLWRIATAGGGGTLEARSDGRELSAGSWYGRLTLDELPAGRSELTLRVWPLTAVEVLLQDAGESSVYPRLTGSRLLIRCQSSPVGVDTRDAFILDQSTTHRRVLLSVPGRYRFELRPGASRLPVEPVEIELVPGEAQRYVWSVDLSRP